MVHRCRGRIFVGWAGADERDGSRYLLEHVREVLGTHDRRGHLDDVVFAEDFAGGRQDQACEDRVVDRHRIAGFDLDLYLCAVRGPDTDGDLPDVGSHGQAGRFGDRPDGAAERGDLGNDVGRRAGDELGDGDDRGIEHIDPPRDHRLETQHDLGCNGDRVKRVMGSRGVTAAPLHDDPQRITGREHRATSDVDRTGPVRRRDVECEGSARSLPTRCGQKPLIEHVASAVEALFAWLEHEQDAAGPGRATLVQESSGAEKHRDVRIVAAGVHPSVML